MNNPGWYPDPAEPDPQAGCFRWWNGLRWTDDVRVCRPLTPAPAPVLPSSRDVAARAISDRAISDRAVSDRAVSETSNPASPPVSPSAPSAPVVSVRSSSARSKNRVLWGSVCCLVLLSAGFVVARRSSGGFSGGPFDGSIAPGVSLEASDPQVHVVSPVLCEAARSSHPDLVLLRSSLLSSGDVTVLEDLDRLSSLAQSSGSSDSSVGASSSGGASPAAVGSSSGSSLAPVAHDQALSRLSAALDSSCRVQGVLWCSSRPLPSRRLQDTTDSVSHVVKLFGLKDQQYVHESLVEAQVYVEEASLVAPPVVEQLTSEASDKFLEASSAGDLSASTPAGSVPAGSVPLVPSDTSSSVDSIATREASLVAMVPPLLDSVVSWESTHCPKTLDVVGSFVALPLAASDGRTLLSSHRSAQAAADLLADDLRSLLASSAPDATSSTPPVPDVSSGPSTTSSAPASSDPASSDPASSDPVYSPGSDPSSGPGYDGPQLLEQHAVLVQQATQHALVSHASSASSGSSSGVSFTVGGLDASSVSLEVLQSSSWHLEVSDPAGAHACVSMLDPASVSPTVLVSASSCSL